jgi:hypothetical protein
MRYLTGVVILNLCSHQPPRPKKKIPIPERDGAFEKAALTGVTSTNVPIPAPLFINSQREPGRDGEVEIE